jgi:hypothetical protein
VVSMTKAAQNTTIVLDTGKNHAGVCRFKLTGHPGDRIVMRYGELLAADGKTLNPMTSVAGQSEFDNTVTRRPRHCLHISARILLAHCRVAAARSQGFDRERLHKQPRPHRGDGTARRLPSVYAM